jgi:tetratricopeptide (TPR) repeat protein
MNKLEGTHSLCGATDPAGIAILLDLEMSSAFLADWISKINQASIICLAAMRILGHDLSGAKESNGEASAIGLGTSENAAGPGDILSKVRDLFSSWTGGTGERHSFAGYLRYVLERLGVETIATLSGEIRRAAFRVFREPVAGRWRPDATGPATDTAASTQPGNPYPEQRPVHGSTPAGTGGARETREKTSAFPEIATPEEHPETYAHFILSETSRRISNQLASRDFAFLNKMDPEAADGLISVTIYRHIPSARIIYIKIAVDNIFDNISVHTDVFSDFGKHISRLLTNSAGNNSAYLIDAVTGSVVEDVRALDGGSWSAPSADEACARLVRFGRRLLTTLDAPSLRRALACFESALRISPDALEALAGAARACVLQWFTQLNPASDGLDRAEHFARRIVEINPDRHIGHQELGYVQLYRRDFYSSVENIARGLELDSGNRGCISDLAATLLYTGRPADANDMLRPSFDRLNGGDEIDHWIAAGANYTLGNYKEAIRHLAAIRDPRIGTRLVASSHAMLNERELANFHANFGKACNPGFKLESWLTMLPIADPSQLRHYEQGLRSAGFT